MLSQEVEVVIVCVPSLRNRKRGKRLTRNASLTEVLAEVKDQFGVLGVGESVVRIGYTRIRKIRIRDEDIIRGV